MKITVASTFSPSPSSPLIKFVQDQSGQNIRSCYQCGKCSAGCPAAYTMDLTPRQIMRALQLGLEDEALGSSTIWVCVFCQTCSVRCPCQIDIARVMESLRLLAIAEKIEAVQKDVRLFHELFLERVKSGGRINELGLGLRYNVRSGHLFANVGHLPTMLSKGKLSILPSRTRGAPEVRAIFDKIEAQEESSPRRLRKGKTANDA